MGATGKTTVNFGAFPGKSDASVNVTGQASIVAGSLVEAWIFPDATADHSADEHLVESIRVVAGNIIPGTGFTIYAFNTNEILLPKVEYGATRNHRSLGTAAQNTGYGANTLIRSSGGGGTFLYGLFTVAWVWN